MVEQIDIFIPYQVKANGGEELQYALKGVKKFLGNYGNIYAIGDDPKIPDVDHIPFEREEAWAHKERNRYLKVKHAFEVLPEVECALVFHDDHFLLRHYDARILPMYQGGKNFGGWGEYSATIQNTKNLFGESIHNYDIHCPYTVSREGYNKLERFDWNIKWGYLLKTLYAYENGIQGVFMPDMKLREHLLTTEQILGFLKERDWVSTSDKMWTPEFKAALDKLYA